MTGPQLKACPFCGGEAKLHQYKNPEIPEFLYKVYCLVCGVEKKGYDSPLAAIKAWNNRKYIFEFEAMRIYRATIVRNILQMTKDYNTIKSTESLNVMIAHHPDDIKTSLKPDPIRDGSWTVIDNTIRIAALDKVEK